MNPPSTKISNIDIAVYALYLLGGWRDRIHTEAFVQTSEDLWEVIWKHCLITVLLL